MSVNPQFPQSSDDALLAKLVVKVVQVSLLIAAFGVAVVPIGAMTTGIVLAKLVVAAAFLIAIMGLQRG